ncbi:MarR family winged helix-turn-helix transcriptional regulator [Nocardioides aurantiacus]|uniref:DNA-binding MarR family transcriptional regulator n=1 Tax=Nocardioides aurantiacus TaxID=86796 RepID=A0A3N2CTM8_9ACTN|nr:MarR family transcriptional regulator [Nocardioides aurantiacus]ROR90758.1 DNA-binding MarR family transcriptional regulator [Nocardioides aurantiacus]
MSRGLFDTLLLVTHLLRQDMARAFDGTPLTEARVAVLWVLQTTGPSTQQQVAAALEVSARNVSALVDALEGSGHVVRTPHPTDRRAVLLELTPTAGELMARMQVEHAVAEAALREAVAPEDRAAFERGLDAVATRLQELVETERGAVS